MDLGALHVGAASVALTLGITVLLRRKGGSWHVALGRVYLALMLAVNLPVLFVYEASGGPGPFHVLAVVSLATTALGWVAVRGHRRPRRRIEAHASFMTWSWIGVTTAGLAQLANQQRPQQSPWPVVVVVTVATGLGLALVPRYVARQLRLREQRRPETGASGAIGGERTARGSAGRDG